MYVVSILCTVQCFVQRVSLVFLNVNLVIHTQYTVKYLHDIDSSNIFFRINISRWFSFY